MAWLLEKVFQVNDHVKTSLRRYVLIDGTW